MKDEAPLDAWLVEPMEPPVARAIDRLRRAPSVRRVAVMPDVHLAKDVCVGTVLATDRLLYPQAVGGDIGCGMLALAFDADVSPLSNPTVAGKVLAEIGRAVPTLRHHRAATVPWPDELIGMPLSHPALEGVRRDAGTLQLGTLGSGNHFVELQSDEATGVLWLMIHSGSRSMGQAIRDHHLAHAEPCGSGLLALDAESAHGVAYVRDVEWARHFADANRRAMASAVARVVGDTLGASARWDTLVSVDHNHVVREEHGGQPLWVHRKGAMPAGAGSPGILPGSMGTLSYHVEGRGCERSLRSSAHGAGRAFSREQTRRRATARDVHRQMGGVWFDYRLAEQFRDEAPSAYKDVRAVVRAQHELTRVMRVLRPVLSYKGR